MARTGMPRASYTNGDIQCIYCPKWVRKKDILSQTHLSKTGAGPYHNVCNVKMRTQPRTKPDRSKYYSMLLREEYNQATPFLGYAKYLNHGQYRKVYMGLKQDILKNKEKWEKLAAMPMVNLNPISLSKSRLVYPQK